MVYEIVTVDWNKDQTRIWRHWAERNCPNANIHIIPDRRPFRFCWSGAKIDCWLYGFEGKRVIYLDTDTFITRDMEEVFDMMEGRPFGASMDLKQDRLMNKYDYLLPELREKFALKILVPPNISSGMIVCNDYDPELVYGMWSEIMNDEWFQEKLGKHYTCEEYAISLGTARHFPHISYLWKIPNSIHGNIYHSRCQFGGANPPMVVHYHRPQWAIQHGFEEYLNAVNYDPLRGGSKIVSRIQQRHVPAREG